MSKIDQRFYEDRALRDAAKAVLLADIEHARTTFSGKGLAERVTGRVGEGAKDVFEVAKTHTQDNRGIIALLMGAVLLWFAREPILDILAEGLDEPEDRSENLADEVEGSADMETAEDPNPNPTPPGESDD
ncbi:hypothetical protein ACI5KX_09475 [Erythrobacter sp. GH1-10]|uniref:hypothetical protein n=1 Tax=Erythrobacter sp. GH1-10 TaxID=3349334 RepID=UPI003877902D